MIEDPPGGMPSAAAKPPPVARARTHMPLIVEFPAALQNQPDNDPGDGSAAATHSTLPSFWVPARRHRSDTITVPAQLKPCAPMMNVSLHWRMATTNPSACSAARYRLKLEVDLLRYNPVPQGSLVYRMDR
jgi:hypothetical protein